MSNTGVFAIFRDRTDAANAVDSLRAEGFRNADISFLFSENTGNKDLAHEKNSKAPEGATAGASAGVVIGGVLGWLAGIGLLAIPGIGPLIAAGPIVAMLAGAGALGVLGGIAGALIGLTMPEFEAKRYDGRVRGGGVLMSVHCDDSPWVKRAKQVLQRTGGEDIATSAEAKGDFGATKKAEQRSTVA